MLGPPFPNVVYNDSLCTSHSHSKHLSPRPPLNVDCVDCNSISNLTVTQSAIETNIQRGQGGPTRYGRDCRSLLFLSESTQIRPTGVFFLSNFDDQFSSNFHRFVILCFCWDTLLWEDWSLTITKRVPSP